MLSPDVLIPLAIVIFFAIGIHEYCHCKFADLAGDPTPRFYGRVTLNLFKHFDPLGTIMIFLTSVTGVGMGWGKPAPINPQKMRNPRFDTFVAVAAGPLSNIIQATLYAFVLRFLMQNGTVTIDQVLSAMERHPVGFLPMLLTMGVTVNLGLALFNLIPLGRLDGHWLVGLMLPEKQRHYWFQFNRSYGWTILVALVLLGQTVPQLDILGIVVGPPFIFLFRLLTGI